MSTRVVACVGAVIKDDAGRLLLIKRGHDPGKGLWSLPGGRVEAGESDEEAVVREVREETGLIVALGRLIGSVLLPGGSDNRGRETQFDVRDYTVTVTGGSLAAGDDADDVMWAGPGELGGLPLTDGLLKALRGWGVVLPPMPLATLGSPATLVEGLPGGISSPASAPPTAWMLVVNMSTNQGYVVKTFTVVKTFARRGV